MEIKGGKVTLVPIKLKERNEFYRLATKSYGSNFWYDEKRRTERTKKEFFRDWNKNYFNSSSPEKGQCFWIVLSKERIGQINYNPIDKRDKKVELDIIIGPKKYLGKGYGSDALKTLIKYLFNNFDINKIWIEARANNPRAINAYKKAGFKKEGLLREDDYFKGRFVDCIRFSILKKEFL